MLLAMCIQLTANVFNAPEGTATFKVPQNTEYLWLVVMGAPSEHWPIVMKWGAKPGDNPEEQWPYLIKLTGTAPDESVIK